MGIILNKEEKCQEVLEEDQYGGMVDSKGMVTG